MLLCFCSVVACIVNDIVLVENFLLFWKKSISGILLEYHVVFRLGSCLCITLLGENHAIGHCDC